MGQQPLTERLRETLSVFAEAGEPWTTPEVADRLDLGRRTTYARLERLVERDLLETKKVGASARVWWHPPTTADAETEGGASDGRSEQVTSREQQFRSLVEAVEEYAIFMLDPEGYVRTWNPGAERIKGYTAEEILGEHFSTFYTDADREAGVPEANLKAAGMEGWVEDEGWRVRKDGSRFWANVTITAIHDDDDTLTGYAKVTRDMTDRRERERQLREQHAFVESLLDAQPDLLYSFDIGGDILRVNDRFYEVTGYTEAGIEEMHPVEFIADRDAEDVMTALEQVFEHGKQVTVELPLVTADGEEIPYEFTGTPLTDEDGEIVGLTGVGRDISDRKARERQLERQRDNLRDELNDVFTRIDEAFFALDAEDWRITYVNDQAAELVRLPVGELMGARVWDVLPELGEDTPRKMAERAVETGDSVEFEYYSELLDVWAEVRAYPSETGLSVYVREITERKEREAALERTRDLLERTERIADVGGWEIDTETREVFWTDHLFEILGADYEEEPPLEEALDVYHEEDRPLVEDAVDAALDAGEPFDVEARFRRPDGEVRWLRVQGTPEIEGEEVVTLRGSAQDVTERKARERELERRIRQQEVVADLGQRALEDRNLDVLLADAAELVADTLDNDYCKVLDLDREGQELLLRQGVGWTEGIVGSATVSAVEADSQAAYTLATEAPVVVEDLTTETRFSGPALLTNHDVRGGISAIIGSPEDPWGILGTHDTAPREFTDQDAAFVQAVANILATAITRHRHKRDLARQHATQQKRERALRRAYEVIADPGRPFVEQIDDLLSLVREELGTDYATLSRIEGDEYVFEQIDAPGGADLEAGDTVPLAATNCERAVATERTLVLDDVETDAPELADRAGNAEWGISCYLGTPVFAGDKVYGTFCFYDTAARTESFSEWQVTFVELLGNWVSAELERQQQIDQLAALNDLNGAVREITEAVIDRSTREEIERAVCDRLAETKSYTFAWIGDVESGSETVRLRTEAGVEGYLEGATISVNPEDPHSEGPTGRALRTGELQVARDVRTDPNYEPWRERADAYGVRSSAAIPIAYEGTVYGVLNVYADRPDAFEGQERAVIAQLGEVVGHAIAAIERKRALTSDEVTEIEFTAPGIADSMGLESEMTGTITFERAVPVGDGEFLEYGTVDEEGRTALEAFIEHHPDIEAVEIVDRGPDTARFELRVSDPPVVSAVASVGGYMRDGRIEDGDLYATIHLPPTVATRRIIDTVKEAFPTARLLTQRQITRSENEATRVHRALTEDLTDRQRTVLETAVYSGFFQWPRESAGEDVADSLEIAPSTFSQHLRNAQRKVFHSLFESPALV